MKRATLGRDSRGGGQVCPVLAGCCNASAIEGVDPGGRVKGPEGMCVGVGPD
jgi:hypothetical protein